MIIILNHINYYGKFLAEVVTKIILEQKYQLNSCSKDKKGMHCICSNSNKPR